MKVAAMQLIRDWFQRRFSDPQIVILGVILLSWSVFILLFGKMLAPVIASVVIAYLLEGVVFFLEKLRIPRFVSVLLVSSMFVLCLLISLLTLFPLLTKQLGQLFHLLPQMIAKGQEELMRLPERYPDFISEQELKEQMAQIVSRLSSEFTTLGQQALSFSLASVRSLVTVLVYLFIVPLLVFFCLKDKDRIIRWLKSFLPQERSLASKVWHEVNQQIGNYIRGKVWEILIVWGASYITFIFLGLDFAMLLGLFVGLSVLIPYIGAIFMSIPVALVAYFQWGWGSQFTYTVIAYIVIQIIDGNILVTLLFSEVVNLHPLAIISAILVFGGLWGFWGLFFAIPLATLVHAILKAWPREDKKKILKKTEGNSSNRNINKEIENHG